MLEPLENLVKTIARLPGVGSRSARRAAMALVREPARLLEPLEAALADVKAHVRSCSRCGGFTVEGRDPCALCVDPARDGAIVCVVEEAADIPSIEGSGAFRGRYHSLGGRLSPARRSGPEKLRIEELKSRIVAEGFSEVVLALSTDMEGDATAGWIEEMLRDFPSGGAVKVTRLAFGLPVDSGIAYSDPLTLRRAIFARR